MLRAVLCIVFIAHAAQALAVEANPAEWPPSARPNFMLSCTKLQQDLVPHCACIYDSLVREIAHAEFLRLSQAGQMATDERYLRLRSACVATPRPR